MCSDALADLTHFNMFGWANLGALFGSTPFLNE